MVFSIPTFTTVGDDYDHVKRDRKPGKAFLVGGPKNGNGPDAMLEKEFKSIHEGDPYVDPGVAERRAKAAAAKKRITSEGFRLASPPKKASGLGGYFGTFNDKPIPHQTDYVVPGKGQPAKRAQSQPRPILTAPPKKGGFGVAGTLLSPIGGEYVADSYEARRERERQEREANKAKLKDTPWRTSGRRGGTFDEAPASGASQCYSLTKPLEEKKEFKSSLQHKAQETAWRPAGKLPKALPPVEYREDPFGGQDPRQTGQMKRAARSASAAASNDRPGWKPNSCTNDTWYTKSIAFARL